MRVAEILKAKGTAVMTVRPTETIQAVAKRFRQEGVGALIVIGDGGSLDGIVTETDVAHGLAVHGKDFHALPASALMTTAVVTCSPKDSITEVARVMTERRLRHLPVKEARQLVGVISIGDVVKHRLEDLRIEARLLRDIVIGSR
jgi:signal-transduction protein with cAMP-binding, CBS, and nucleotidyltransferase domain